MDFTSAVITPHAAEQMNERQIIEKEVREVLAQPEAVVSVGKGRVVVQAIQGRYLVRVFVDTDRNPPEVVTVYRTSRIEKYRRRT